MWAIDARRSPRWRPEVEIERRFVTLRLQKGGDKLGYEAEAFAIYDTMRYVKPAVGTVCVGSAYGEAAMLLAAGEKVGGPPSANA